MNNTLKFEPLKSNWYFTDLALKCFKRNMLTNIFKHLILYEKKYVYFRSVHNHLYSYRRVNSSEIEQGSDLEHYDFY